MIEVVDDFLEIEDADNILGTLIDPRFTWNLCQVLDPDMDNVLCHHSDNIQFVHQLFDIKQLGNIESEYFGVCNPIFKKLNSIIGLRAKINLGMRSREIIKHGFHTDLAQEVLDIKCCKTSIFYVNTNNGYTEFEDGTKVESVANRLVTFPSHLKHTGTTCTDAAYRIVINFNYISPLNGKKIDYINK